MEKVVFSEVPTIGVIINSPPKGGLLSETLILENETDSVSSR